MPGSSTSLQTASLLKWPRIYMWLPCRFSSLPVWTWRSQRAWMRSARSVPSYRCFLLGQLQRSLTTGHPLQPPLTSGISQPVQSCSAPGFVAFPEHCCRAVRRRGELCPSLILFVPRANCLAEFKPHYSVTGVMGANWSQRWLLRGT